ncbi:hypothetical protein INS49_009959 [Diaporthe citri]|uniref:uncharacterized protein n=1 Tax=Diaporthe citri TaxID=83186 RepID=UPI001C80513F|nr:uncharacterized protein INS49_009959 [Diaporthe citri]KAG6361731.1 hypothetical protein INS49_009959 [Diaporthe citri]
MKFSPHTLLATPTALDVVDEASAPCYFANGDQAEGYHTCDVKSPVSSCCPSGYTCSGNALCVLTTPSSLGQPDSAPGTVSRGACTEPRWNGNSCGGNCLDSEDATGGAGCHPVGDGGGERDCCAGGNAPGSCICSSNVAEVTLGEAEETQMILGRRAARFSKTTSYPVRPKQARLHHASKTVSQGVISTEAGSSDMFTGHYSSWVRTSSSVESVPLTTPLTPPTWSGDWSEKTTGGTEELSKSATTSQPGTITSPSIPSTETPMTTTISIIASSLIRSSSSSPSSSTSASISPSVPTVVPIFPDGASSDASPSPEAATSSLATKLGLGLAIPLVVLAVALLTACVYRRQRRLRYARAPPFDFNAPETAPVSAADFAPAAADHRDHHPAPRRGAQQQTYRSRSDWGAGVNAGAWAGTRTAAWGGGWSSYDDSQVDFVGRSHGNQGYYYPGGHGVPVSSPVPAPGYEDLGSPYEDRGHAHQVPVVQVHRPQWTPAPARDPEDQGQGLGQGRRLERPPRRDVARVSRGLSVNEEVSPLSSTGSGMPYPRTSAISGMGWEANPRVSRG